MKIETTVAHTLTLHTSRFSFACVIDVDGIRLRINGETVMYGARRADLVELRAFLDECIKRTENCAV